MRQFLFASLLLLLASCSFEHIAEVRMQNKNNEPILITLETKNIMFKSDTIPAYTHAVKQWNWTNLDDGEGHITITINYLNTQLSDSFEAGQYNHKTLSNYIDISTEKGNLQFKMSD